MAKSVGAMAFKCPSGTMPNVILYFLKYNLSSQFPLPLGQIDCIVFTQVSVPTLLSLTYSLMN